MLAELVTQYSQVLVATAAAQADLVEFERPSFHDRLQRTMANATSRPVDVTYAVMGMVTAVFTVAGVTVALAIVQPILLVLALVAFGPVFLVARRFGVSPSCSTWRRPKPTAAATTCSMLLSMKPPAKELRAYDLAGFFTSYHGRLWDQRIALAGRQHAAADQARHRRAAHQRGAVRGRGPRSTRVAPLDRAHERVKVTPPSPPPVPS